MPSLILSAFMCIRSFNPQMDFSSDSMVKNSPANSGDMDLILYSGRSPGEKNGYPLQYYSLGNPMDRGTWQAMVHGVTKS